MEYHRGYVTIIPEPIRIYDWERESDIVVPVEAPTEIASATPAVNENLSREVLSSTVTLIRSCEAETI